MIFNVWVAFNVKSEVAFNTRIRLTRVDKFYYKLDDIKFISIDFDIFRTKWIT